MEIRNCENCKKFLSCISSWKYVKNREYDCTKCLEYKEGRDEREAGKTATGGVEDAEVQGDRGVYRRGAEGVEADRAPAVGEEQAEETPQAAELQRLMRERDALRCEVHRLQRQQIKLMQDRIDMLAAIVDRLIEIIEEMKGEETDAG